MSKISKWLKLIATGSVSLLLSACYGVQTQIEPEIKKTFNLITQSNDGLLIPDLKISFQYGDTAEDDYWTHIGETDESGAITLELSYYPETAVFLKVEDVDGELNGSFKSKVIKITDSNTTVDMEAL